MTYSRSLYTALLAGAALLTASTQQSDSPTLPQSNKFVLEAGPHEATDLLNRYATFLERNILWSDAEFKQQGVAPFVLQNRTELDARSAEAFVGQLFYTRNFVFVPLDMDRGLWQLINSQGSQRSEIMARPVTMSAEKVMSNSDMYFPVRCAVPLEHIRATTATTTLRPFFHSGGPSTLIVGNVGADNALMLQGYANQVANAIELLRMIDAQSQHESTRMDDRLQKIEARLELLEQRRGR